MHHPKTGITRREFASRAAKAAVGALALGSGAAASAGVATSSRDTDVRGIRKIIRYPKALEAPLDTPPGKTWRYMLNYPFQVAPNLAAAYVNFKDCGFRGQDFEAGNDIVLFDRVDGLDPRRAHPVSRLEIVPNPNNGGVPAYMNKYPGTLGFVPFGAKGADGRPHPHAGTGFVMVSSSARPVDESEGVTSIGVLRYRGEKRFERLELYQLSYDGRKFTVGSREIVQGIDLLPGSGHVFENGGMGCAIPDGDDLLTGADARLETGTATAGGLMRWRRTGGSWRPARFDPVSPYDQSLETTVVRDLDDSLLVHVRARPQLGPPIRLWRRAAEGKPWERKIHLLRMTPSAPITLGRAVDGTPFIACNLFQPQINPTPGYPELEGLTAGGPRGKRSTICINVLNEARDGFEAQFIARDPLVEFGAPPRGSLWAADHPTASVVRLADNAWHCVMGYRMLEWKENTDFVPPCPQTGSYLDEIVSYGSPRPLWNF
ncbi:MAG: hypothetical protein JNG83_10410 [Opitutaceae bacterium]|nr:hypothetical protein [Opitutaceae bacterium]